MKHHEARKRVKRHIRKRGSEPLVLTQRIVTRWWNLLNTAVFYGSLPRLTSVQLLEHKKEHAWAIPGSHGEISVSMYPTFASRQLFLSVLIHEMVHAWEFQNYPRAGHGKRFFTWKHRIKRTTNLILQVRY